MIRKNTILSLVVACGLLLVGSAAYAQVDGRCQSIGARAAGALSQLTSGINVVNNCNAFAGLSFEFIVAGCDVVDDTVAGPILENGELQPCLDALRRDIHVFRLGRRLL